LLGTTSSYNHFATPRKYQLVAALNRTNICANSKILSISREWIC